jgi:predicted RNA-binding Zn ribbon-like protein
MPNRAQDLPDDLPLPLDSGEPWWYFTGGRVSVDFANTLRERWHRRVETLVTTRDLQRWLTRAGVLRGDADPTEEALDDAREVREVIDRTFLSTIEDQSSDVADVATIDRWLRRGQLSLHLVEGPSGLALEDMQPPDPVRHALGLIALDAAQILGDRSARHRLRICASETCSARFFDNSPAGRRQWCSMSGCGNVAKARRYRARHARKQSRRNRDASN